MNFIELCKERYSCKSFSDAAVEPEKLDVILEAGRLAATAKNLQEQSVYVIVSEEGLAKIDEATPCRYGAPVVLAVCYDKNNVYTYPGEKHSSGIEDATIVATHMMLAATSEGLGSCWLNFFDPDKLKDALDIPENEELVMLLDIGYASENGKPLPNHESRKPIEDTVKYI